MNVNSHFDPANPEIAHFPININTSEQTTDKKLESFRSDFCSNISADEMKTMIEGGKELENTLVEASKDQSSWEALLQNPTITNPDSAVKLVWLLTSKVAAQDVLFTSGAIRIGAGKDLNGEKLEQFLCKCGQGQAYSRLSTHMKENLKKNDVQWGLDLRNKGLPANKATILFAKQPDGSLYIKTEPHGCPPFWKNGFVSLKNFKEFVGHSMDFVTGRSIIVKTQKKFTSLFSKEKVREK